ncbi:pseudouridine synthase [Nakamurella silvestris]|nr:pseudouridine synthase [Nakamurella silvestris]
MKPVLPLREGLNAIRHRLPENGSWPTVLAYLSDRFPADAARLPAKMAVPDFFDAHGQAIHTGTPFTPGAFIYLYRDPPAETPVPFELEILHQDRDLLVVDKPHFLASTPRGSYVAESALVRLRRDLGLPELSPAHRLDRITAGVLVLTVRPEVRGAYQTLFAERRITKVYEAVAPLRPELSFPRTVRSRIVKERGILQAQEVPGVPNSETVIELAVSDGSLAGYRLSPRTGKTHQLRVHMSALGIPIVGDNFYPRFYDVAPDDYTAPLQLLARSVTFTDPISGRPRTFVSGRRLEHWPG